MSAMTRIRGTITIDLAKQSRLSEVGFMMFLSVKRYINAKIEYHDRVRHAERGHFDRRERQVLSGQVEIPDLPRAVEIGEIGMELLCTHHVGKRSPGCAANALSLRKHGVHLKLHGTAEVRLTRIDARFGGECAAALHRHQSREEQQVAGADRLHLTVKCGGH